jgi:putative phosphoesterase
MTVQDVPETADAIAGVTSVEATRIGLIGDDHNAEEDGSDLPAEVLAAFEGVDLIVHLGHMGVREKLARGVLDRLATVAPVLGVRDYSTDQDGNAYITPAEGSRVAGLTRVIEAGGLKIGALHNVARPPGPEIAAPPGGLPELGGVKLADVLPAKFGTMVDVVAFASTHRPVAISSQGVLFVNPGSPSYPKGPGRGGAQGGLGTVGILDVVDGVATFELVELSLLQAARSAA